MALKITERLLSLKRFAHKKRAEENYAEESAARHAQHVQAEEDKQKVKDFDQMLNDLETGFLDSVSISSFLHSRWAVDEDSLDFKRAVRNLCEHAVQRGFHVSSTEDGYRVRRRSHGNS